MLVHTDIQWLPLLQVSFIVNISFNSKDNQLPEILPVETGHFISKILSKVCCVGTLFEVCHLTCKQKQLIIEYPSEICEFTFVVNSGAFTKNNIISDI